MQQISNSDLLLMLLGIDSSQEISNGVRGITRVQKYIFLLEKEYHILPSEKGKGFEFVPYKAGPYSSQLYDDLELLENLEYIKGEPIDDAIEEESVDIKEICFEDLMGDASEEKDEQNNEYYDGFGANDACQERRFCITNKGRKKICDLINSGTYEPVVNSIRKLKGRFSNHSLPDLLYYIYTKYPDMTVESEIKDKVLRRRK
ncbi:MAG: hypothetical protein LBE13_12210 [Bacteroidales bacterium]|jgi:hypothetical protein|nr:hypothetical protein [Bacteroidales bacterium]